MFQVQPSTWKTLRVPSLQLIKSQVLIYSLKKSVKCKLDFEEMLVKQIFYANFQNATKKHQNALFDLHVFKNFRERLYVKCGLYTGPINY